MDLGLIKQNHLLNISGRYRADRAEIFWQRDEIDAFVKHAPNYVGRILIAASETGLRPSDLVSLSRFHIETSQNRILLKTKKRPRTAAVPITIRMQALIDQTPKSQTNILVTSKGAPYSKAIYLGDAVSRARDDICKISALRVCQHHFAHIFAFMTQEEAMRRAF